MIVYKITNLINGKIYIGKQIRIRENDSYFGSGILIKKAVKKYGIDNFKKDILEICGNKDELNERETFWIKEFNSIRPNGYNIAKGGEGGDTFLNNPDKDLYRKNSSIASKKLWKDPNYREKMQHSRIGSKRSQEARKNMSLASSGKPKSESHRKSLSAAWDKRRIEKPVSRETLKKMSNSMKGKNKGKYIQIHEFLSPDGKIYRSSEGIAKFARDLNKHPNEFKKLVDGLRADYGGWKYLQTIKK